MKVEDLKIEVAPTIPKGGQTVGIIPTGVRITHVPTGIYAFCEVEISQMKNKNIAMAMVEYGLAEIGWRDL